jgi:hypothetical protein
MEGQELDPAMNSEFPVVRTGLLLSTPLYTVYHRRRFQRLAL